MKPVVWITGASSGIGQAVALEMARLEQYTLILSGRNETVLKELASKTQALYICFDVSVRQQNLDAAEIIREKYGRIDIAFFNAGLCEYVDVTQFDSSIFERTIQTNFISMVYGVEAALPLLRCSENPHLVGMSSSVAYIGLPRSEAYGASKAAIRNFLQGLRLSLLPEKILVSMVLPGFIKTPLTDKNDFPMPSLTSVSTAAEKIVAGIQQRKLDIIVPTLFVRLLQFISILPNRWSMFILKKLLR